MISTIEGIRNDKVLVAYDKEFKTIIVQDNFSGAFTCFAEFADMKQLYEWFKENITEETDYVSAIRFFRPVK